MGQAKAKKKIYAITCTMDGWVFYGWLDGWMDGHGWMDGWVEIDVAPKTWFLL